MNYIPEIFTRSKARFTPVSLDGLTRKEKDYGDITYFEGDTNDGIGRYEFDGDLAYQEGTFKDNVFLSGTYRLNNTVYRGNFTMDGITGTDFLNDDNGEVEWIKSGIIFSGRVVNDKPDITSGTYVVPVNTEFTHNKVTGALTFEGGRWVGRFTDGPVKEIVGEKFNISKMRFDDPKKIVFRDGCTFEGVEYFMRNDPCTDTFTAPPGTDVKKWTTYQLNLWLIATFINMEFEDTEDGGFFYWINQYKVTGRQFMKFSPEHFEFIGADCIQSLQIMDALQSI
jgi:hypothetical protein